MSNTADHLQNSGNRPRSRRVTLAQLAEHTGLGRTTVSDILNRNASDKYSEETRNQVHRAVEDLGYMPVRAAQQLASGRSGLIGLLLMRDFGSNLFFARLAALFENSIRKSGYRMQLAVSDGSPETRMELTRQFQADAVEGVIVGPAFNAEELAQHQVALRKMFPSVFFGLQFTCDSDQVVMDQVAGRKLVIEHLVSLGHRRIAYLEAPADRETPNTPNLQNDTYRMLESHGVLSPEWIFWRADDGIFENRYVKSIEFVNRWKACDPAVRPTAVICHNDQTAITALCALAKAGIRVPQDISVIGYDNLPESAYLVPPLTTVELHIERQVELILEALFKRIRSPESPKCVHVVTPTLVVRESTRFITADRETK